MEKKNTILLICANFPPEPIVSAKLAKEIAEYFRDKNYYITVVKPKPSRPLNFKFGFDKSGIKGINEIILNSYVCPKSNLIGRIMESISFGIKCSKYIKDHYNDISCIYADSWPLFSQLMITKTSRKHAIKTIIHVQDIYPESYINKLPLIFRKVANLILLPIDKNVLNMAEHIIVISDNMKSYLESTRKISKNKMTTVLNWQDEDDFLKFDSINKSFINQLFTFMYMGNIGPVAGVDFIIKSFVNAKISNARLVIAGGGSMKNECEILASNYYDAKIEFWDVPDGKVPEIQSKADVMILPLKKGAALSSIPSKLPAYMFSSKPIIGSLDCDSDTAKAIIESNCGWITEPENINGMTEKIINAYSMTKEELSVKGKNGFNYAIRNLSKRHNLPKLTNVIEKLAKESCITCI